MKILFSTLFALTLLCSCGITPPTKIVSNKSNNYSTELDRIFVITTIGSEFGDLYGNTFEKKFIEILNECNITVEITKLSALDLDPEVHQNKLENFKPEGVLTIKQNGGTKMNGVLNHVIYDLRLFDVKKEKMLWRANTDFYRGDIFTTIENRGITLALDLTNKMKEDNLFGSCSSNSSDS